MPIGHDILGPHYEAAEAPCARLGLRLCYDARHQELDLQMGTYRVDAQWVGATEDTWYGRVELEN